MRGALRFPNLFFLASSLAPPHCSLNLSRKAARGLLCPGRPAASSACSPLFISDALLAVSDRMSAGRAVFFACTHVPFSLAHAPPRFS